MVAVDMSGLLAQVRALAEVDVTALDDVQVQDLLVGVSRLLDAATVVQARAVAVWDERGVWQHDGSRCASSALSRDVHCSPGTARQLLSRARRLERTPGAADAAVEGRIGIDLLDLLGGAVNDDRHEVYRHAEAGLIDRCAQVPVFDRARREVQHWAMRTDEDLDLPAPERHTTTAFVHHHRATGVTELHAEIGVIDGHLVRDELTRLVRQIRADDRRHGRHRSYSERLGAALTLMATRSANSRNDGSTRAIIQVIAGDDTMRRACELASGEVLHQHELLPHLDTATFETFLFGDHSTIVTVSPSRTFRGALRRAIQVRDRHCRHESGCDVSAVHSDVDHITPVARAGPTSQFNGRSYCTPHNRTITTGTRHPAPERLLGPLDALRARLRWQCLQRSDSEARELDLAWHMTEVERLLHTPLTDEQ
jgi:Domain of unknown function (DUF222)